MNKQYNLKLDLQFRCNNSIMKFDQFDNNTSDFFIRVTRAGELIDISKAIVTLVVIKPDGSVDAQFVDIDSNRVYCDLKPTMKNIPGKYEAIASITVDGETVNTDIDNPIIYEVTENKFLRQLNEEVVTEKRFTLLTDMINRLSSIETNENTRIENENAREEREKLREQAIEKIKTDIANLISNTKKEINDYKEAKDIAINEDLRQYKEVTNQAIENYKSAKDTEINNILHEYKSSTDDDIEEFKNIKSRELDDFKNIKNIEIDNYQREKDLAINKYVENKNSELDKYVLDKNKEIDRYKEAKDKEIDLYKTNKDTLINNKIIEVEAAKQNMASTANSKISEMDQAKTNMQNAVNSKMTEVDNAERQRQEDHQSREEFLNSFEYQIDRIDSDVDMLKNKPSVPVEIVEQVNKNTSDNKRQDVYINGLFRENSDGRITITEEGNVISLEASKDGIVEVESLEGNTLVNYCTDGSKELTLNGDIDLEGTFVTTTEGVDNGLVDVMCEGNTLILDEDGNEVDASTEGARLVSVGQDDKNGHKIEILSNNKNLLPIEELKKHIGNGLISEGLTFKIINNKIMVSGTSNIVWDFRSVSPTWTPNFYKFINSLPIGTSIRLNNNLGFNNYWGVTRNNTVVYLGNTITIQQGDSNINAFVRIPQNYSFENDQELQLQIEFGTNATNYVTPQLNKKEILLNEPLRGLSNSVKDRFVKIGGKLYIERNCGFRYVDLENLNKCQNVVVMTSSTTDKTYLEFSDFTIHNHKPEIECISDKLVASKVIFSILDSLTTPTITTNLGGSHQWRLYVPNLTTLQEYKDWVASNPFEVVYQLVTPTYEPLEINPELITYTDTTHISNNSIIPCNMKIQNTGYNAIIKPSTLYTITLDTNQSETIGMNLGGVKGTTTNNVLTLTTPATLTDDSLRLHGKGIKGSKVRLLEGDKTNWIPSFFEGMKSSFEDKFDSSDNTYKMEILSNNKNLFNESILENVNSNYYEIINKDNRRCLKIEKPSLMHRTGILNQLKKNTSYKISFDMLYDRIQGNGLAQGAIIYIAYTDGTSHSCYAGGSYNEWLNATVKTPSNKTISYIQFSYGTNTPTYIDLDTFIIQENSNLVDYIYPKTNKIQFSSIEPLRGIKNIKDRFIFKDGKLMIERNIKNIVFDGSQSGYYYASWYTDDSLVRVSIKTNTTSVVPKNKYNVAPISPKYPGYVWYTAIKHESIHIGGSYDIHFILDSNRFKTKDLQGAKEFLSKNPIDVCYVLEEPIYEEIPFELQKIILEGYENGTLFFDTNIPVTSKITYTGIVPSILDMNKDIVNIEQHNVDMVATTFDMDYRLLEVEWALEDAGITGLNLANIINLDRNGGVKTMALSRYEQAKIMILGGAYDKETLTKQLTRYEQKGLITKAEYDELISLMEAKELVIGE